MDPRDKDVMLGTTIRNFLDELIENAPQRGETLHFVSTREMVNIILSACDGRDGNPAAYRDYRFKRARAATGQAASPDTAKMALQG
jgi:hypothetical protein